MGSYAPLTIDGYEVAWFKNGFDPSIALLFGINEYTSHPAVGDELDRWDWRDEPDDEFVIHELVSSGNAVRERLDVLGIGMTAVTVMFEKITRDKGEQRFELPMPSNPDAETVLLHKQWDENFQSIREMTIEKWLKMVGARFKNRDFEGNGRTPHTLPWLMDLWEEWDTRVQMRAILEALPHTTEVRIDFTDVVFGGWVDLDTNPHQATLEWMTDEAVSGSPVVVLTEGQTDARFLQSAVEILKPHLIDYLRFVDFTFNPESNASALLKTVKMFASAGIRNRIVAVFDSDTAAEDVLFSFDEAALPKNISIFRLPRLKLASLYPVAGPEGLGFTDVNGLAASIELYLGEDVLRDDARVLREVQWMGFNKRLKQ